MAARRLEARRRRVGRGLKPPKDTTVRVSSNRDFTSRAARFHMEVASCFSHSLCCRSPTRGGIFAEGQSLSRRDLRERDHSVHHESYSIHAHHTQSASQEMPSSNCIVAGRHKAAASGTETYRAERFITSRRTDLCAVSKAAATRITRLAMQAAEADVHIVATV